MRIDEKDDLYSGCNFTIYLFIRFAISSRLANQPQHIFHGTIYLNGPTPSPSPIPTPDPFLTRTNLAPIPEGFDGQIACYKYILIDEQVKRNGSPTIRLDPDYERGTRECNAYWINVYPGDRIYFGVWCKTSNDVTNTIYTGGRIGIDFWGGQWGDLHVVDGLPMATH